jgi:CBS domain-containing protein
VIGIFSERDLVYGLAAHGPALFGKRVGDVMTPAPKTIRGDKLAVEAVALMEQHRINQLVVVDANGALEGALAGIASQSGVTVHGMEAAAVSYPGFTDDLVSLGAVTA